VYGPLKRRTQAEGKELRTRTESKRKEVTGELRKFHNDSLHYLQFMPNIIDGIVSRNWMGEVCRTHGIE
jgi:hypothetical protein